MRPPIPGSPPVVLFTFNRPDHTRRTLEALAANTLARETDLTIYSDAPRRDSDREAVAQVRELIRGAAGFRSVRVIEREQNLGLARSIVDGVGAAIEEHGRVVVLEDDIVTSPHFLTFMRDALDLYADDERVMHVSGCRYAVRVPPEEGDTFFLRVPLCWGWATWGRAWKKFRRDTAVFAAFDESERRRFDFDNTHPYWRQAEGNIAGTLNTWFIFWYACLFKERGLALFPRETMATNIGHDGSGVHCGPSQKFDVGLGEGPVRVMPREVAETSAIVRAHLRYFRFLKAPRWRRSLTRRLGLAPLG